MFPPVWLSGNWHHKRIPVYDRRKSLVWSDSAWLCSYLTKVIRPTYGNQTPMSVNYVLHLANCPTSTYVYVAATKDRLTTAFVLQKWELDDVMAISLGPEKRGGTLTTTVLKS
jgi:hypothetical protein